MRTFTYEVPSSIREATSDFGQNSDFIAGGTTLIDLMKLEVMTPSHLVDINRLPMRGIELTSDGLRIGALEKMSDVAEHPEVVAKYPVISQALLQSASAQLRNMASMGGNLLQRTRCGYFRDVSTLCNKRQPGTGCPAIDGWNRTHAILGTSSSCVATHPSDLAVALVALDASILLQSGNNVRLVKLDDFYRVPAETPDEENQLRPGELITEIRVPRLPWAQRSVYLKIRDRESYEFALASVAVALDVDANNVRDARVAVGCVGTKPWNLPKVRDALIGKPLNQQNFEAAAKLATEGAKPLRYNAFKVELVQRTIVRALMNLGSFSMSTNVLGKPHDRMEGRLKVTGGLRYSGDQPIENGDYGYLVTSTIARGEIRAMDVSETEKSPGVVAVYTPFHSLKLYDGLTQAEGANSGEIDPSLQDNKIRYYGQIIALVVADSFEQARDAAARVKVDYREEQPVASWEAGLPQAFPPAAVDGQKPTVAILANGVSSIDDVIQGGEVAMRTAILLTT